MVIRFLAYECLSEYFYLCEFKSESRTFKCAFFCESRYLSECVGDSVCPYECQHMSDFINEYFVFVSE